MEQLVLFTVRVSDKLAGEVESKAVEPGDIGAFEVRDQVGGRKAVLAVNDSQFNSPPEEHGFDVECQRASSRKSSTCTRRSASY